MQGPRKKISSVAEFWDLLQGAKGAQSYGFSHMRAQFLLCPYGEVSPIFLMLEYYRISDAFGSK